MQISVFGLGYVGCVTAGCLADAGHHVVGVDVNSEKVDQLNDGSPTVIENDLRELIEQGVSAGRLRATESAEEAVQETRMSLICVGTPSASNGSLDPRYVRRVCGQIGSALYGGSDEHVVVIRSTVTPGTTDETVRPVLEENSGRSIGDGLGLAFNPEFLREGSAVRDFWDPPKTVIGSYEPQTARSVSRLYDGIDAPMVLTSIGVAELVKYADNAFHALKVAFANEIGTIAAELGIDGQNVMDIFCRDTKLNLSSAYLRPGFAFGGSCLPKDLRALTYLAKDRDLEVPLLDSVLPSNEAHWKRGLDLVLEQGKQPVGILGFSFKAGTDDLRESPVLTMVERLIGKGFPVRIYDRNVSLARLTGSNREYLEKTIPHIAKLLSEDIDRVVDESDVIVIGNRGDGFREAVDPVLGEKIVIDLVRLYDDPPGASGYTGIAW